LKKKSTQPLYIFNRENPQNSEPQNGPRSGLDYIALSAFNLSQAVEPGVKRAQELERARCWLTVWP
jgi:hypothetical protein